MFEIEASSVRSLENEFSVMAPHRALVTPPKPLPSDNQANKANKALVGLHLGSLTGSA